MKHSNLRFRLYSIGNVNEWDTTWIRNDWEMSILFMKHILYIQKKKIFYISVKKTISHTNPHGTGSYPKHSIKKTKQKPDIVQE